MSDTPKETWVTKSTPTGERSWAKDAYEAAPTVERTFVPIGETTQEIERIAKKYHFVDFIPGDDGYGGEDEVKPDFAKAMRELAKWKESFVLQEVRKQVEAFRLTDPNCEFHEGYNTSVTDVLALLDRMEPK